MEKAQSKDERFWNILNCALELDSKRGHLRWSMTELAKKSGESRTLIYYYFGKSKEDVLNAAVDVIGAELFGITQKRLEHWTRDEFEKSIKDTHTHLQKFPNLAVFFLTHRARENNVGLALREYEKRYLAKMRNHFPDKNDAEIESIWCYIFGIVSAPVLADEVRRHALELLREYVSRPGAKAKKS